VVRLEGVVVTEFNVSRDGTRFLVVKEARATGEAAPPQLNVVLNWLEELKQRVPVK
jgi:orotate phosphoribosyltransferase-like protein